MTQMQAEQSQQMLQRFQQQMEEEMIMRQKMMSNQMQMLTRLQTDFPNFDLNMLEFSQTNKTKRDISKSEDEENELEIAMKERIKDIESIFKTKEEKLVENYEYIIKDLENKLDIEQGRYRDAAETHKEEKEKIIDNHKAALEKVSKNNNVMYEAMKSEYLTVIDNLKTLRKVEIDAKAEVSESASRITKISENLDLKSKYLENEKKHIDDEMERNLRKREQELQNKEKELLQLQEVIIQRQEASDNERRKLTEAILNLENQLQKKELELESQIRQSNYEKEQLDFKTKQFEQEKDAFLENLKKEKNKIYQDRDYYQREVSALKNDLAHQLKQLKLEKAKYTIHKRLKNSSGYEPEDFKMNDSQEVEELIKVLENEKGNLKRKKDKMKEEEKNLSIGKRKLMKQRNDVAAAIEKLYEVERGINDKFEKLTLLQEDLCQIKDQGSNAFEDYKNLEENVSEFLQEIEGAIVDLLKQEQRVKTETLTLTSERKKINETRKSILCSSCAKPMKRAISSKDFRKLEEWDDFKHAGATMAWMDLQGNNEYKGKFHFRNIGARRSAGDGASLEALDSHVSAFKRDAENDKKYLKDEMDYLKTLQCINVKTLAKYQS